MKRVVVAEAGKAAVKKSKAVLSEKDNVGAIAPDPDFSRAVIAWQKQHGRHALPWQNTRDAYRVWLSEIMLQQTQVAAVIPYYLRFLESFPTVADLAAAPSEQVMAHWSGLGYYSRARNLHRCAQIVMAEHGGQFSADPAVLETLPGIGRSTAAAISAFSYGTRAAILDGNVKRVFARVFGIDRFPGEKAVENEMWQRAVALLPDQDVEAYTQGLMDLGATLCTRNRPDCPRCPLANRCVAYQTGRTAELPVRKPKKAVPERYASMLAIVHDGQILLEQRPDQGIWGGLLSLPEFATTSLPASEQTLDLQARMTAFAKRFGVPSSMARLQDFSHGFTHFKLHVVPYRVDLQKRTHSVAQDDALWYPVARLADAPLPAPVKKLLVALFATSDLFS
ncbi:MAG: A/G-specific adenine glycosylase [Oxalicibacterium faecigallinarum]|uniref:A/G-specific adenine glycosylase n=1 Tax=Oxalicibacterium faecigallinarum TaxID=573741 RepID=UPI0028076202|nr:A/G-specific adenine glycosylase [Oxalicibacterium faecigallinarum]MDQ7968509.1 A/G-specific adenine glycosylase [Oxalicibacterium faecigallinarum]